MHVYDDVNVPNFNAIKSIFLTLWNEGSFDGKDNCGKICFLLKDSMLPAAQKMVGEYSNAITWVSEIL
jgi:hypothetical protein